MKTICAGLFVLMAVLTIVKAEEVVTKEKVDAVITACKEEVGASDDDVTSFKQHLPDATKEGKCLNACVFKKVGLMSDEGKMVRDATIESSKAFVKDEDKKAMIEGIVDACEALPVDADHCEAASQYGTCLRDHAKEHGIEFEEL